MFFWRRVASQIPEEGLKPTAAPGYTQDVRDLNNQVSRGKSFSGYERNSLFLNRKGQGFIEAGGLLGVDFDDDARAVASMDWDRDGDLDLWVTNRTAPRVRLLRNNQPSKNSFVSIRLIGNGETTNRDAIGARLTLSSSSNPKIKQIRTVRAGDGFLSQSSSWTHFGLGDETKNLALSVKWPGGTTESYSGLKAGARYAITQGEESPRVQSRTASAAIPNLDQTRTAPHDPDKQGFWVVTPVPFPQLTWTEAEGATRSTTEFLGKPVLINLWATWCLPCIEELSAFAKHAEELRAVGATILALNVDGLGVDGGGVSTANAEDLLSRVGYTLPHGVARQEHLAKIETLLEYLTSRRAPLSLPSSFLVNENGNVAAVYLGPVSWAQLANDLALLKASPASQLKRVTPRVGRWLADPRQSVDRQSHLSNYAALLGSNGFPEESRRLYQMINREEPVADARAYYNQAKSAAQQGLRKQAMELYRVAIQMDPEYGQALTGLGALLLLEKRIDEAQVLFERSLSIDPNHATALINLATIDQSRGDSQSALKRLRSVVARNPGYAQAHLNLGSLLASMTKYEEAIHHLSTAVVLNPKMVAGHMNLAATYTKTEQWQKAEEHYHEAHQLSPRMAAYAHYGLGNAQARQHRHVEAVASYRKAISLGANNAQTLTQLGRSLRALGENQAAVDAFKSALKLDPKHNGAKQALSEDSVVTE